MADFSFSVDGLDKLNAALTELGGPAARRAGTKALRRGANVILTEARLRAPVLAPQYVTASTKVPPGTLRKTLHLVAHHLDGDMLSFSVVTGIFYANFVELGTSRMAAQPFLRPAAENKAEEALAVIAEVLGEQIDAEAAKFA